MSISANSEATILPIGSSAAVSPAIQDMMGDGSAWGLCTALDFQGCNPSFIRYRMYINRYVVELCELMGRKRVGECLVGDLGEGRVAGYSMAQLISTSLISGHFANGTNNASLAIFSRKGYDSAVVESFSNEFFGARRSSTTAMLQY